MGKVKKALKTFVDPFDLGGKAKDALSPDLPDVKSADELESDAAKKANRRRRARSKSMKTDGRTIFTSARGVAGMKTKVGQ